MKKRGETSYEALNALMERTYIVEELTDELEIMSESSFGAKLQNEKEEKKPTFSQKELKTMVEVLSECSRQMVEWAEVIEEAYADGYELNEEEKKHYEEIERVAMEKLMVMNKSPKDKYGLVDERLMKEWNEARFPLDVMYKKDAVKQAYYSNRVMSWEYLVGRVLKRRWDWFENRILTEKKFESNEVNEIAAAMRKVADEIKEYTAELEPYVENTK